VIQSRRGDGQRAQRWRLWIALVAPGAVLMVAAAGLAVARMALPQTDGRATLDGLLAEVRVRRDTHGVPHIDASEEADAWTALGYVHAQDRLFQMDLARRAVAGRLAELVGPVALPNDRRVRRLGLARTAERQHGELPSLERALLAAYARGVNAAMTTESQPLECYLLRYRIEPWRASDSLLILKYMEDLLSPDGGERRRAQLVQALGHDVASYLFDFQGLAGATILPPELDGAAASAPDRPTLAPVPRLELDEPGPTSGSNAWAISGARTVSGRPLLANDTHLPAQVPAIFYQAHVRFPDVDVVGLTIPGIPYIVLGHNGRVAWGVTTLMSDQVDWIRLELDPDDRSVARGIGGPVALERRTETILVRGEEPDRLEVWTSPWGPIVEEGDPDAAAPTVLARQWTADVTSRTPIAIRAFARARDVADLLALAGDFTSPGQNLVAADVDGHIGWYAGGTIPIRRSGTGRLPVDAARARPGWRGLVAGDQQLRQLDPERGFVVTANNQIGRGARAMQISTHWAEPARADRIVELLEERPHHDVASLTSIQLDARSQRLLRLLAALPAGPLADAELGRLWRRLRAWDATFERGPLPTIASVFERELMRALFADDAGDDWRQARLGLLKVTGAYPFTGPEPAMHRDRDWIDDSRTPARESMEDVVATALEQTLVELRERFGPAETDWSWQRWHRLELPHPLGRLPLVGRLFNVGPAPVTGTRTTVNANGGSLRRDFAVTHIPVFRMVIDLADPARSRIVLSAGQSGHVASPHYDDQFDDWVEGRTRPMLYAEADVADAIAATLTLVPATD